MMFHSIFPLSLPPMTVVSGSGKGNPYSGHRRTSQFLPYGMFSGNWNNV